MRVAVLAGGCSPEHDVSLASARSVLDAVEHCGHSVEPIVIGRDGVWRQRDPRGDDREGGRPVAVIPGGGTAALLRIDEGQGSDIDVVFPVLHGPYGEDGTVQGLLECADVPYVGASVLASARAMDKTVFKALAHEAGLPQVPHVRLHRREWESDPEAIRKSVATLGYPAWVKPACLGSSIGISCVRDAQELSRAVTAALHLDSYVIVEGHVDAREVECAVIGNDEPRASAPGEILVRGSDWYDYESKYASGGMDLIAPADLEEDVAALVRRLALDVYQLVGCSGLARVDFFVRRSDGEVLVNEINTIPGFTSTSVWPRLFMAEGAEYPELVNELLQLAVERHGIERRHAG